MVDLRAYAVAVVEVRGLAGAAPEDRGRLHELARRTSPAPPLRVRDLLGPIHRRVPGTSVVRDDDPAPADLDTLLAGAPVPADRVTATWRLVERLVAGLAHGTAHVPDADVPPGLLGSLGLPLPATDGLVTGWCTREAAEAVRGLRPWLAGFDGARGWTVAAARAGRPAPDLVVFSGPT